jgi:hypothetical protein
MRAEGKTWRKASIYTTNRNGKVYLSWPGKCFLVGYTLCVRGTGRVSFGDVVFVFPSDMLIMLILQGKLLHYVCVCGCVHWAMLQNFIEKQIFC